MLLLSCLALVALLFYEQPLNSIVKKNNELLQCLISMTAIRQEVSFASPYSVVCGICTNWFCNCNKRKKNCSILQPTAKRQAWYNFQLCYMSNSWVLLLNLENIKIFACDYTIM